MIKNSFCSLPKNLAHAVSGYAWREIHTGLSAAQVYRLEAEKEKPLYLKIVSRTAEISLLPEKSKLDWLENRLPVPAVLSFAEDENFEYLLLSAIPGVDAGDDFFKGNGAEVIKQLTESLQIVHDLPIADCPFDVRLDYKIELARRRMLKGLVDEEDFDEERTGRTAADLFDELIATRPTDEDLVFTHGDYCLPNIILENRNLSGFVDWGNAGVADRYQDIALLTRSIRYNFGESWERNVFEIYGIEPNIEKIKFYRLLDEFF